MLFAGGLTMGFVLGRELASLDRLVRERFEGRLFRVPSRVMSAPTILYPGLDWSRIGLRDTLLRLGYRESSRPDPLPVGHFHWDKREVRLHRRAFEHPSRGEPARIVHVRLDGPTIVEIYDVLSRRDLGALFLEPEQVGAYYGPDHEQRDLVRIEDVPQHLIDAVLAVEDQRFLEHSGIDLRRIAGALLVNLRERGVRQGGSTLTQQLVKNFFLTPERTVERKIREAAMALIVEARYDKQSILEAYLNEIYLGQRGSTAIHGFGEASRFYFGKSARQLSLSESAMMAAIIRSPNGLNPHRHPEAARERRDLVLKLMAGQGRIDETEREEAAAEPLRIAKLTPEPREARYFLEALRRQLPEFYDADLLSTEGLVIYSTLDLRLQRAAARAVALEIAALEKASAKLRPEGAKLQACLVALRPQTGEVLALVGGRSYAESQFDRCSQGRRPPGSAFKPFVLAAALEPVEGRPTATLATMLDDSPFTLKLPGGDWRPANFDGKFHGRVSLRESIERSLNVPIAKLGQQVGIDRVIAVAHRLGIESGLPRVPSLALGTADLSPLEMARAYTTLANGGIRPQIRTFEDVVATDGRTAERQPISFERVLDPGTAYLVTSALEGVVDRGTARRIRAVGLTGALAGKTGTSDDERDAWFVGYSQEMVVAVWVGFDQPRSLGLPSSRVAVPLFIRFLQEVSGGHVRGAFRPPGDVSKIEVEPQTGARALSGCPDHRPEYFLVGTEPETVCPAWATQERDPRARDANPGGGDLFERFLREFMGRVRD